MFFSFLVRLFRVLAAFQVTDLAGEARFVSAVAKRLKQLGAMTRGDRHSGQGVESPERDRGETERLGRDRGDGTIRQNARRNCSNWTEGTFWTQVVSSFHVTACFFLQALIPLQPSSSAEIIRLPREGAVEGANARNTPKQ